jgi:hypothetical protein
MPVDAQLANSLFRSNNVADECPACGRSSWRFGKDIVSLPYASDKTRQTGMHAIPTICNNCGHIKLFLDSED